MSEITRSLVSQLRRFVGDRRRFRRKRARLPFNLSLIGPALSRNGSKRVKTLRGHTLDVSETGLALIVPAILLGEHHLIGENRRLRVELQLTSGNVEMEVLPIRYESLEEHQTETGYLIGAKIVDMSEDDRIRFTQFVNDLPG